MNDEDKYLLLEVDLGFSRKDLFGTCACRCGSAGSGAELF